jgi:hypothetical protein
MSVIKVNTIQNANGTTGITFAANGQMTLANTPLQLTGGQIAFPATQIASADGNTLDDYEEGTFTTTWSGSTSGSGVRGSGSYTKIGRLVTVNIVMDNVTFITFVGSLFCTLPFTAGGITASQYIGAPMYFYTGANWNTGSTTAGITPDTTAGNTYMTFNYMLVNGDRQAIVSSGSCALSGATSTYARFSLSYISAS